MITDDRGDGRDGLQAIDQGYPPNIAKDVEADRRDVLQSPYLAFGTFEQIADQIREVRRRTTMSYVGVFPTQLDAFAPVLALLKGEWRSRILSGLSTMSDCRRVTSVAALTKYDLAPARTPVQAAELAIDDTESVSTEITFALRLRHYQVAIGGNWGNRWCREMQGRANAGAGTGGTAYGVETTGPPGPQEK